MSLLSEYLNGEGYPVTAANDGAGRISEALAGRSRPILRRPLPELAHGAYRGVRTHVSGALTMCREQRRAQYSSDGGELSSARVHPTLNRESHMRWCSHFIDLIAVMGLALCASGCNGSSSSSSSSSSSATTNASAAGIWTGTDSASGLTLSGIVNAAGLADFIRSDGVQYVGTVQISGTALAVTLNGYTQFGDEFSDGSTYGVGTLNATVSTGSSISGTLTFTTSDDTATSSTWSLTFDSLYDTASSLSTISGNYSDSSTGDPLNGATVSITSGGVITAQSSANGCVLNGRMSTNNTSYDVYEVSYSYESCTGTDATLNGIEFTGLAILNSNVSPVQIVIGVTGQNASGTNFGLVSGLTAT